MIKIGLVGTGGMGTVHYSNYKQIENAEVVALVGVTQQSAEFAKKCDLPLYECIDAMASTHELDVVDICTPTFVHKEHVMQSLDHGLHVITEKPIALKKKDAEEMYARAAEKGKQLYVAQVLQFTKEIELLHRLVKNEEYGKPLDAFFERLSACPRWAQDGWLFDKEKSGLLPFDLHIHDLDAIVSLFGVPQDFSFTSCGGNGKPYKEHYRFIYRYANFNVAAEAAWFNADIPFTARWRVYFENALVVNDGSRVMVYQVDELPQEFDVKEDIKIPTGINLPPTGMFFRELSHFMDCVRHNSPSERVSKEQVLTVVELLERITQNE